MSSNVQGPAKRRSSSLFVFATVFIDVVGIGLIAPVTPSLLAQISGKSLSAAAAYGGWLVGVFALLQFIASPALGNLSDRYGRRPVLLVALLLNGVSYVFMGLAGSLVTLFLARCLGGLTSATQGVATAYVADITTKADRSRQFGLLGAAFSAGWIIGPGLGGVLGEWGPRMPFYAAGALAFANTLYGFLFVPESLPAEGRRKFDLRTANPLGAVMYMGQFGFVLSFIAATTVLTAANSALPVVWPYSTMEAFHWSQMQVGLSITLFGVLNVFVQTVVLRLSLARLGEPVTLYASLAALIIAYIGFAFAPVPWVALVSVAAWALGSMSGPIVSAMLSEQVPPDAQGALQGALGSVRSLVGVITPIAMTSLFSYATSAAAPVKFPGAPYLASAVIAVLGSLILLGAVTRHRAAPPVSTSG